MGGGLGRIAKGISAVSPGVQQPRKVGRARKKGEQNSTWLEEDLLGVEKDLREAVESLRQVPSNVKEN
jgi:hypothetical protein